MNFYHFNEVLENKYYPVPQELFENDYYNKKLCSDSKILYGIILNRLTLSNKNNWIDKDGKVYLIFTREEVMKKLNISKNTATKVFKELEETELIKEKKQGLGKPNLIYVGKVKHQEQAYLGDSEENYSNVAPEEKNIGSQESQNLGVRVPKSGSQESQNLGGSNTDISNTENSNNKYVQNSQKKILNKKQLQVLERYFEIVWKEYPKKVGKAKARNYFIKWLLGRKIEGYSKTIKLTKDQIWYAVLDYKDYCEKEDIEQQFIKNGDTFFNLGLLDFILEEEIKQPNAVNS